MAANNSDAPPSDALVLFGVTGDLARKKIFPALDAMVKRGVLDGPEIGIASSNWSPAQLHQLARGGGHRRLQRDR